MVDKSMAALYLACNMITELHGDCPLSICNWGILEKCEKECGLPDDDTCIAECWKQYFIAQIENVLPETKGKSKKYFLIGPVRNATPELRKTLDEYVAALEAEGHEVYYPPRDTDQTDPIGVDICVANRKAIEEADEILIAWDGQSTGSLFDMGMVWAFRKPLRIVKDIFPPNTETKSFAKMVRKWQEMRVVDSRYEQ